jgi:hypothetical protein
MSAFIRSKNKNRFYILCRNEKQSTRDFLTGDLGSSKKTGDLLKIYKNQKHDQLYSWSNHGNPIQSPLLATCSCILLQGCLSIALLVTK